MANGAREGSRTPFAEGSLDLPFQRRRRPRTAPRTASSPTEKTSARQVEVEEPAPIRRERTAGERKLVASTREGHGRGDECVGIDSVVVENERSAQRTEARATHRSAVVGVMKAAETETSFASAHDLVGDGRRQGRRRSEEEDGKLAHPMPILRDVSTRNCVTLCPHVASRILRPGPTSAPRLIQGAESLAAAA